MQGFMEALELVVVVEEGAWATGSSYFVASIVDLSTTEATIDSARLAIVDCNWNLENFVVAKDLVVGSNLARLAATVGDFSTSFGLLARDESSKQKSFDSQ